MAHICATVGLLFSLDAAAVDYAEEFTRKIQAARAIAPLGSDLFGDETNWYNGQTTFRVVDVDIPGNNALPVRIARTLSTAPPEGPTAPGLMGEWELELPYLSGVFPQGNAWRIGAQLNRCSWGPLTPPAVPFTGGAFAASEYWRGYFVSIPGQGSTHLLWPDPAYTPRPTDGFNYPWVTVGHTQLHCGITLANSSGEGFLAVTPDGMRYRFDWLISRPYSSFVKPHAEGPGSNVLQRVEVRIYATRVEDRFGNTVNYTYTGEKLTRIESNDGRVITLTYNAANKVASVTAVASAPAPNRTWTYSYSGSNFLTGVTLPDATGWSLSTTPLIITYINSPPPASPCDLPSAFVSGNKIWTFTHPSGASAQFTFTPTRHARTQISQITTPCRVIEGEIEPGPSREFDTYALVTKALYGVGLTTATWTVTYGLTANDQKVVTQTHPDNTKARYTFGTRFYRDEGKVLRAEVLTATGAVLRNTVTTYAITPTGQAYAYRVGSTLHDVDDAFGSTTVTTTTNTTITQDSATFGSSTALASFDLFARPLSVTKSSSLGFSKTEQIAYHDNQLKWVLGQVARVTVGGVIQSQTDYHAATALPWREYAFGKLMQTLTYNADGTPATVANGAGETTTLSSWKRGLPQLLQYPDSSSQSAVVDDLGWIRSVTDERNNTTAYSYDVMGRISAVTYPTGDTVAWTNPSISYLKLTSSELGVIAGSWRRQEVLGGYRERTYYDGRLRPILREQMDTGTGQAIYDRHAYDYENQETFTSYPSSTSGATAGINATYDALGRLTKRQTTDATPIVLEQIAFLTGSKKQVTDADSKVTKISYQAFDAPDYSTPTQIESHSQISITDIARDVFGKISGITQSGSYGGGTLSFTRSFTFDINQRPCRRVDPETGSPPGSGSTVWGYDTASRIAWEARGQSGSGCLGAMPSGGTSFTYDLRGRLKVTNHPGTADDVTRNYDLAGNLTSIVKTAATWSYSYNKRNLLESEQAQLDSKTFLLNPTYNALAQVSSLATPAQTISYAPDAFGRARQLGSYVTAIQYHANGLPSAYTLGSLTYTQTLNNRQWPQTQETKLGATPVQKYVYSYSQAGNLTFLDDQGDGVDDATLTYDNLHRLTTAAGLWGSYTYAYDPLHNIRSRSGPSALTYSYDGYNRLAGISGAQSRTYTYNAKGEITGDGSRTFTLNPDGQITAITGVATYIYDGHGKRIKVTPQAGSVEYALYSLAGDLIFTEKGSDKTDYLKLGGNTLVELKKVGSTTTATHLHPDLLGSPRKATSAAGGLLWQEHYDPYGRKLNGVIEKIGYTGHAHDAESDYTYMQARFYDPLVGRFLSTDPIHFTDDNPFTFNRYSYANDNPYRYRDPTGAAVETPWDVANVAMGVASFGANAAAGNVVGAVVDAVGIVIDVAAAATLGVPGGAGAAIKAARGLDKAAQLKKNVEQGAKAEKARVEELGDQVAGTRVTLESSTGQRSVADIITKDKGVREVKSGNPRLSSGQKAVKADIDAGRDVIPRGKNAEKAGLESGKPTQMSCYRVDKC